MKGQAHLGLLLEMNVLIGVQLLCLNIPDFGESYETVWVWMGWGGGSRKEAQEGEYTYG